MKSFSRISLLLFLALPPGPLSAASPHPLAAARPGSPRTAPPTPVAIIFDTDIESDVDDVGAAAVLHALADRGEAEILAMGVSAKHKWSAPCLDALNTYYGRPDIPIGIVKGPGVEVGSKYAEKIARTFPHELRPGDETPDAALLYRKILARRPDQSVVLVSVGFLTNLKNLLLSGPDGMSPLSGKELVRRKVKTLVSMSCGFPDGRYWNVFKDPVSAKTAIENWPTPIVFTGAEIGSEIFTGPALISTPPTNPVRRSYELYNDLSPRPSWDQTAVLYAVRGLGDFWDLSAAGRVTVREDGFNSWKTDPAGRHYHLIKKKDPREVAAAVEALMVAPARGRENEFGSVRFWLEDALVFHGFTIEETARATKLSPVWVKRFAREFGIRKGVSPAADRKDTLLVLPYPGGRHPRIGFLEGAVNPQRGTKVSIFLPWKEGGYVVLDLPEALWTDLGLTFLAHRHIPTVWEKRKVKLPRIEWRKTNSGELLNELTMPNGIAFRGRVIPRRGAVDFELEIRNGSSKKLSELRAQVCLMLKGAPGFNGLTAENKLAVGRAAACRSRDGKRWIVIAWEKGKVWWNPDVPCMHSDPRFPDAPPGAVVKDRGRLFFWEGEDVRREIERRLKAGTLFGPPSTR